MGRNILDGNIHYAVGGGLCQLAGIIYDLAVHTGMEIVERHSHSVDIYTDDTRYAPLGMDSAVAYGYKDLRFKNPYDFPVYIRFDLTNNQLSVRLVSDKPVNLYQIGITRQNYEKTSLIRLSRKKESDHLWEILNISEYLKYEPNQSSFPEE